MAMKAEVEDLPRANVKKVVKTKLTELAKDHPSIKDISLNNDALSAFSESARIFIHYLAATANDICNESKRQVINAEDVLKAAEEMEFPDLLDSLKSSLEAFRKVNASKKAENKSKSASRKRKIDTNLEATNGDIEENTDAVQSSKGKKLEAKEDS